MKRAKQFHPPRSSKDPYSKLECPQPLQNHSYVLMSLSVIFCHFLSCHFLSLSVTVTFCHFPVTFCYFLALSVTFEIFSVTFCHPPANDPKLLNRFRIDSSKVLPLGHGNSWGTTGSGSPRHDAKRQWPKAMAQDHGPRPWPESIAISHGHGPYRP